MAQSLLTMNHNKFNGSIPSTFWYLTQLIYLDLSYDYFNDSIFHNLRGLEALELHYNALSGPILFYVVYLTNLS